MAILSAREKLIMQTAFLQAGVPLATIAKSLGMREYTVRRGLETLYEKRIFLAKRPYVNAFALGLAEYLVFVSLTGNPQNSREEFLKALCRHERIGFVAEVGGDYHYEIRFYARGPRDFTELLDLLTARFRAQIQVPSMGLLYDIELSGMRYAAFDRAPAVPSLRIGPVNRPLTIDETDHRLLSTLANNNVGSVRELARRLELPPATAAYRLANLEKEGVIVGYYHLCDPKPLGESPLSLLVFGSVLSKAKRNQLLEFCRRHNQVMYADLAVGPWMARIYTVVERYEQELEIIHQLYAKFPDDIQAIRIMPQLRFHKISMYPFQHLASVQPAR